MCHDDFFYVLPSDVRENTLTLRDTESHHLTHVMRRKEDDLFWATDGRGYTYECRISAIARQRTEAVILQRLAGQGEPDFHLSLAVAIPKKSKFEWIVEKGTEVGVSSFIPLLSERTLAHPQSLKAARLEKIAVAAMKQCKRATLPSIEQPQSFSDFCEGVTGEPLKLIAHEKETRASLASIAEGASSRKTIEAAVLCVGPEGGFTDTEIRHAGACGFHTIGLGPRRLRTETAALVAAVLVLNNFQQLR